jgi:hypothetical protein
MSNSYRLINIYFKRDLVILFSSLFLIFSCQPNQKPVVVNVNSQLNSLIKSKSEPSNSISTTSFCNYSTLNNPKGDNLHVEISYPCDWELKDGESTDVVKKFSKLLDDGSLVEGMLVAIKLPIVPYEPTKEQLNELLSDANLKSLLDEETDTFISGQRVKIDGKIVGKIVFETSRSIVGTKIAVNAVEYIIFGKFYYIRLQYSTIANSVSLAQKLFKENESLFTILAEKTKLFKD